LRLGSPFEGFHKRFPKGPSIYTVDPVKRTCNCDDWWYRGGLCKHLRAALATPPLPAERLGDILPL
jgi:hypothetical protein